LQEVIGRLDQQQQLYQESKCDGAENDADNHGRTASRYGTYRQQHAHQPRKGTA
jgi:hypothetical protein